MQTEKTTIAEHEAIEAVVSKYTEGMRTGDSALAKQAFHDEAQWYGYLDGTLVAGPMQSLYDAIDNAGPAEGMKARIEVLDVAGSVATVKILEEGWHGYTFDDFFSLVKIDGAWLVCSKVYHQF